MEQYLLCRVLLKSLKSLGVALPQVPPFQHQASGLLDLDLLSSGTLLVELFTEGDVHSFCSFPEAG